MADDILPPLPPGEERRAAAKEEKKVGFLGKLFSKKKEKPAEPAFVPQPLTQPKASPRASPEINLDAIRKELGLNPAFGSEVAEPAMIIRPPKAKEEPKLFGLENSVLSLPDIEMPPEYEAGNENLAFESEGLIPMPPKIVKKDLAKKEDKKAKGQKPSELKPKQVVDNLKWTSDLDEGQGQARNAEFIKDTIPEPKLDKPSGAPGFLTEIIPKQEESSAESDFARDVSPKEVKRLAEGMKRKQFEEKKGISYEPEVNVDDKPELGDETLIEEGNDETLFDDSPEREIENLKAKLFAEISAGRPKEEPPKTPLPPTKDTKKPMKIKLIENELKVPQPPPITGAKPEEPKPGEIELPELLKSSDKFDIDEPPEISISKLNMPDKKPVEGKLIETKAPAKLKKDAKKEAQNAKAETKDAKKGKEKDSRLLKAVEKEIREKVSAELADKIRIEERAKIETELESQRQEIASQKQELKSQKQEFEKSRQAVEHDKIMLAGKINQYDFKEKQLKKEKSGLEQDRDDFRKETAEANDLIKKLPSMRADYESLQSKMKPIYEKLKEYQHKESDLLKLERSVREKQLLLAKEQSLLEETEEQIHEKGFSGYLEDEASKEPIVSKVFESRDLIHEPHLEVFGMIDQCKVHIKEKNLPEAKRTYMQIRDVYSAMKISGPDKDLIYTAVRELYDDIKLAEMDSPAEM